MLQQILEKWADRAGVSTERLLSVLRTRSHQPKIRRHLVAALCEARAEGWTWPRLQAVLGPLSASMRNSVRRRDVPIDIQRSLYKSQLPYRAERLLALCRQDD